MLKFDSNHKSINGSLKNNNKKFNIRDIIIGGMVISCVFMFSGCAKNVECDINDYHAHNYVSEDSFDKYMVSEKDHSGKWVRTDEYIVIDKEIEELIKFENKEGLFRISNNQDKIKEITSSQNDYIEYRYRYTWLQPIPHHISNGKTTTVYYTYITQTGYSWSTDSNRSGLTGEQRVVHYVYYGYKVVKDEEGNFVTIKSEMVDNIADLPEDYIYIKSKFYKKVNLDNKSLEVDYEDGPEEEKSLNEEQQAEYEKQLEQENQKSK